LTSYIGSFVHSLKYKKRSKRSATVTDIQITKINGRLSIFDELTKVISHKRLNFKHIKKDMCRMQSQFVYLSARKIADVIF